MVVGRKLPAVADAVASGSLPTPAPAHTWGQLEGEGYGFCEENAGPGRNIQGVKVGWVGRKCSPGSSPSICPGDF